MVMRTTRRGTTVERIRAAAAAAAVVAQSVPQPVRTYHVNTTEPSFLFTENSLPPALYPLAPETRALLSLLPTVLRVEYLAIFDIDFQPSFKLHNLTRNQQRRMLCNVMDMFVFDFGILVPVNILLQTMGHIGRVYSDRDDDTNACDPEQLINYATECKIWQNDECMSPINQLSQFLLNK